MDLQIEVGIEFLLPHCYTMDQNTMDYNTEMGRLILLSQQANPGNPQSSHLLYCPYVFDLTKMVSLHTQHDNH